jgi:hypothetical protein
MNPATHQYTDDFAKGKPGNATEVLLLFTADYAQYFVPINQAPYSALSALEDVVQDALSPERSAMETLLSALQELRDSSPTHFHYDIYSLQYEIIRKRLPKCTQDFSAIKKKKKKRQRPPQPQTDAKWPTAKAPAKAKRASQPDAKRPKKAIGKFTVGKHLPPGDPIGKFTVGKHLSAALNSSLILETSASTGTPAVIPNLNQQLAQAQQTIQRMQHEQQQMTIAKQQRTDTAPPSDTSIPKTQVNEQGGDDTVVETGQK